MNLILIGLRGSGKTTLAWRIAERLRCGAQDLNNIVAGRMGCLTVAEAWKQHGEAAFRAAESEALRESLREDGRILALGGGTPTAPGAAEVLRGEKAAGRAKIVYLAAAAATLRARLANTDLSTRPSLTGAEPLAEIEAVLAVRDALFRELADVVVETDGKSIAQVVEEVVAVS